MHKALPLIGVTGDSLPGPEGGAYRVGDKYMLSPVRAAGALSVMIPPLGNELAVEALLDHLDGVMFTGSPANLDPVHYGGKTEITDDMRDPARDATNLRLIKGVIEREIPFLCICRGHQELNVALGGSLHQKVQDLPGRRDHRSDKGLAFDRRYDPAHPVSLTEGGRLAALFGECGTVMVNSLHQQAIDRLAAPLQVEAVSDDGVIEAVSLKDADFYHMSVQWHPEHAAALPEPINKRLFESFGEAAYIHSQSRQK